MSHITTYVGIEFDPLQATENHIDIRDIAHALSLLCRANGHFSHFYSVGQHSLNCMDEAKARGYSRRVQLGCLLHDASEAYLSDVTRPIKEHLPQYREYEEKLQQLIYDKHISPPLTAEEKHQITEVDDSLLYFEFLSIMNYRLAMPEPQLLSRPAFDFEPFASVEQRFLSSLTPMIETDTFVGVDWMNGQWIATELQNGQGSFLTFDTISQLCEHYATAQNILIDIPIGLAETGAQLSQRPDKAARKYLKKGGRTSSVFPAPLRPVVYADSKEEAWELNRKLGGKLTPPAVGILPCIRQVDEYLTHHPLWRARLIESHPECAFQALNNGTPLAYSKHTAQGLEERRYILQPYVYNIDLLLQTVKSKQQEDVLDALCLAVTAQIGFKPMNDTIFYDNNELPMRIVIADK